MVSITHSARFWGATVSITRMVIFLVGMQGIILLARFLAKMANTTGEVSSWEATAGIIRQDPSWGGTVLTIRLVRSLDEMGITTKKERS